MLGAGPIIGLNTHGAVWGGEASAGLPMGQVSGGYENVEHRGYARLDLGGTYAGWRGIPEYSGSMSDDEHVGPAARMGFGYGWGDVDGGVFMLGGGVGFELGRDPDCDHWRAVGSVSVELRYSAGDWQVVLAPRVEGHQPICKRDSPL